MVVLKDRDNNLVKLFLADTFFARLKGLFSSRAKCYDGIVIKPCNSVHTIGFMRKIDVIFLSADGKVIKVVHSMKPNRFAWCSGSRSVVEIFSDKRCYFSVGDVLHV